MVSPGQIILCWPLFIPELLLSIYSCRWHCVASLLRANHPTDVQPACCLFSKQVQGAYHCWQGHQQILQNRNSWDTFSSPVLTLAWSKKSADDEISVTWVLPSLSSRCFQPQTLLSSSRDFRDLQKSFSPYPTSQATLTPERSTFVLYLKVSILL